MAELEYDIVLARPGFNKKYNREVSWDELRKTFLLYKRIPMIVAGGSHSGPIDPNNAVGFVDAKIDDDKQTIRGNAIFFKERFEAIPADIQSKLAYRTHVPASLGYEQFGDLRKVDHVLIGAKQPVFEDIGFNAEDTFRYEDTDGINSDAKAPTVNTDTAKDTEIQALRAEIKELKELFLSSQKAKEPEQTKQHPETPVEVVKDAITEKDTITETDEALLAQVEAELSDLPTPRPQVEPERVLPRQTSASSDNSGWSTDELGHRFLSIHVAGQTEQKKKER
jgi:hypothetical protein